ncbi:MAG: glutamyl-tRNA reductase [Gammaproteobacteria bacterium]|nr:glutamyl-tRNA reductase [Gammaproteobacteria bacterium]MCW8986258.1 glutamyl-tRNA reductase [Gammaproteobacteria bacterium]MCW9031327.1 glutamyl-tRNA reductase [Gammaproteobacteria bacterium]
MTLIAFGINHKTAPVDIREKVAFAPEKMESALHECVKNGCVNEAAIVSTCNRTELYFSLHDNETKEDDFKSLLEWFCQYHKLNVVDVEPYIYLHSNNDAVQHILRVASGLDSLVLGEPQILGQIKDAYSTANDAGTIGRQLNRLFQHTFSVAKQVRTDTAIGASPVSVAFAAVTLSKRIFANLSEHTALLIGAGETTELVARHLADQGVSKMIVANRTVERAQTLANNFNAEAIALSDMPERLVEADIIIASTASQLPILGKGAVERALKLRKHRPMFMVDIAVPRDIEPEVGSLDDVYLYTVDDLHEVIEEGRHSREEAAKQAEEIIENQVDHFMGWLRSLKGVDTIRAFREQAEQKRDEQLAQAHKQLAAGKDPEQIINELARTLTNKLIHEPTAQLNQAAYSGRKELLDNARELFNLEPEE